MAVSITYKCAALVFSIAVQFLICAIENVPADKLIQDISVVQIYSLKNVLW